MLTKVKLKPKIKLSSLFSIGTANVIWKRLFIATLKVKFNWLNVVKFQLLLFNLFLVGQIPFLNIGQICKFMTQASAKKLM